MMRYVLKRTVSPFITTLTHVDLGLLQLWSVKGHNRVEHRFKKSEVVEAYTVSGMTTLKNTTALTYNIIQGSSNAENFANFMVDDCFPLLYEGDWVIGDNQNYHVGGWSYNLIQPIFAEAG